MLTSFVNGVERYAEDYLFLDSIFSQFSFVESDEPNFVPNLLFIQYQSNAKPALTMAEYVRHIMYYTDCSRSIVLMALIQIRRLQALYPYPLLIVNAYTIHRLVLTAVRLCMKFHDDFAADDQTYAMVVGVKPNELASLERHMFERLGFNVFVKISDFWALKTIFIKWYGYVVESSPNNSLSTSAASESTPESTGAGTSTTTTTRLQNPA